MHDNSESEAVSQFITPRPSSRRSNGISTARVARPESRGNSVMDFNRPVSRIARLQSASRPGSSILNRQGTSGFRVGTGRPPSGMSTSSGGGGVPVHAQMNLLDRPVTQQGVSGVRTARTSYGNRRMVHDKTYFIGILHTKMGEISTEIKKISEQSESLAKEQATYLSYEKRVKELAAELTEMQGELSDYNIVSDMIVSGKEKFDLEEDYKQAVRENKVLSQKIETIYNRRREAEKQVGELESKIQEERTKADRLVETLNPELRNRYEAIREENFHLQNEMQHLQSQLDELNAHKNELTSKISLSEVRRLAAQLEQEFIEISEKRDELLRDSTSHETPEEERERLLQQVKIDNLEIGTLERQITESTDEFRQCQNELKSIEQEIEANDSDRQQKFRELKKREEEIDEFMSTFEEKKDHELETIRRLENDIENHMDKITKTHQLALSLPETGISSQSFAELKDDLQFKEEEVDKAKYTTEMIESRNEALKKQLDEFETLEEKMKDELISLEEKMDEMRRDMLRFQDTEKVKSDANERNVQLHKESKILEERMKGLFELLKTTKVEHDKLQIELDKNDVYKQLKNLEKKWAQLEQSNFELCQVIKSKKNETNYEDIKEKAMKLMNQVNTNLQNKYAM